MIATVHAVAGATLGAITSASFQAHPGISFLAGLVSHYILDAIHHTDPGNFILTKKEFVARLESPARSKQKFNFNSLRWPRWVFYFVLIDLITAGAAAYFLVLKTGLPSAIWLGALGGLLPDFISHGKKIFLPRLSWSKNKLIFYAHQIHKKAHNLFIKDLKNLCYDSIFSQASFWGLITQILILFLMLNLINKV